jgi:hypothetical protein
MSVGHVTMSITKKGRLMALDLEIRVKDRESGNLTEMFTQLSLTSRELGYLHMLMESFMDGEEIIKVGLDN